MPPTPITHAEGRPEAADLDQLIDDYLLHYLSDGPGPKPHVVVTGKYVLVARDDAPQPEVRGAGVFQGAAAIGIRQSDPDVVRGIGVDNLFLAEWIERKGPVRERILAVKALLDGANLPSGEAAEIANALTAAGVDLSPLAVPGE